MSCPATAVGGVLASPRGPIRTVHLVYPYGDSIAAPSAIGRHLSDRLRTRYEVINYDWTESGRIRPKPGEALVGHPSPERGTVFRRSCSDPRWGRVILLQPYCHGVDGDAFLEPIIRHCDLFLAITGGYWFRDIPNGRFGHWLPKMRHVDLAVDRNEFPALKSAFSLRGMRRFVYIGGNGRGKNVDYLAGIARRMPAGQVAWIGGHTGYPELSPVGWVTLGQMTANAPYPGSTSCSPWEMRTGTPRLSSRPWLGVSSPCAHRKVATSDTLGF